MKRTVWLVGLAIALSGCSLFRGSTVQAEPETPEQRECRAEARGSADVRALDRQSNPNNAYNLDRITQERRQIESRAYRACLRARGLALPGGVEAVVPR